MRKVIKTKNKKSVIMKYLCELKRLRLPKNKYAIFGSGPLGVRKLREINDLDIIVKRDLWKKLTKKYLLSTKSLIKVGHIEIFKNWLPWLKNVNQIIDTADLIYGIKYVNLKYVLKWKKLRNTKKDKKDIKLIKQFLIKNP